jgi:hypothetical protein
MRARQLRHRIRCVSDRRNFDTKEFKERWVVKDLDRTNKYRDTIYQMPIPLGPIEGGRCKRSRFLKILGTVGITTLCH